LYHPSIIDNCGGIDIQIARDYAFRFGRSPKYAGIPYSVGQFGIGMKRALFKIAKKFEVHSKTVNSSFILKVNVDDWESKPDQWNFYLEDFSENIEIPKNEIGTKIIVSELTKEAQSEFSDDNFIKSIQIELEKENMYPISKGLKIILNRVQLKERDLGFITSPEIKPSLETHEKPIGDGSVTVKIYAGISESKLSDGGWYIFCNGRMILGPERTAITGWTGRDSDGIPVYHSQYDRFRGYVYFESKNPSLLPWNTTKNGVDIDSPLFKFVRQRMIQMAKPIITFLNNVKKEKEGGTKESEWFLETKMSDANAKFTSIRDISNFSETYTQNVFQSPTIPLKAKNGESEISISYKKPKSQVDKVKNSLGTTNNKELGELTFQYYFDREIDE
jgi:Histidine kinase-, DNA gyrase B-, and HSP90-like ATPase